MMNYIFLFVGLWTTVHFLCRARFLPTTAPWCIRNLIVALTTTSSAVVFFILADRPEREILFAMALLSVELVLFDLILWVRGMNISKFFGWDGKNRRAEERRVRI